MQSSIPTTSPSNTPLDQSVREIHRDDSDPLPTTLILTPLRTSIEENGTVWNFASGVVDTVRERPVLTLTCYPTAVTSKAAVATTAAATTHRQQHLQQQLQQSQQSQQQAVPQPQPQPNGINSPISISKTIGQINDTNPKLTLGRNETTLITDSNISRNVCTINCNYDELSSKFEFRLIRMRSGMVSLNGSTRRKCNGNGGGSGGGTTLKTGDVVSLHDKERDRRYPYRVDIMVPQRVGLTDDDVKKLPSKGRVKDDRGPAPVDTTIASDTAIDTPQPKRPETDCEGLAIYDGLPPLPHIDDHLDDGEGREQQLHASLSQPSSSLTSSSTTSSTVPPNTNDCQTKEDHTIKVDPAIKEDPAVVKHSTLKENLYDAYSSTRKRKYQLAAERERAAATNHTESSSSSSSTVAKPHPPTAEQIEQQLREQQQQLREQQQREQHRIQEERRTQAIEQQRTTAQQHVLHELSCSICMEILVKTHVAHPCGHLFCGPCLKKMSTFSAEADGPSNPLFLAFQPPPDIRLSSCPTCRVPMAKCTLARSYDNVIWNMILMGTIFRGSEAEGDLRQFLLRSGRQIEGLSPVERDCIFGRNHSLQEVAAEKGDNDNDDCHIVKRVMTNSTWMPPCIPHPEVDGVLDLTEPLVFDVSTGANMDDPICL